MLFDKATHSSGCPVVYAGLINCSDVRMFIEEPLEHLVRQRSFQARTVIQFGQGAGSNPRVVVEHPLVWSKQEFLQAAE